MSLELHRFLKYYNPYVNNEWRNNYFSYDSMKAKYKTIKEQYDNSHPNILVEIVNFEKIFLQEIENVYNFMASMCHDIETDLTILLNSIEKNQEQKEKEKGKEKDKDREKEKDKDHDKSNNNGRSKKKESAATIKKKQLKLLQQQHDRTIEISLRSLYDKIKDVELFYHLNYYSICKISKKLEKLLQIYHVMVDSSNIHIDINTSGGQLNGSSKIGDITSASSSFNQGHHDHHRRFHFPMTLSGIGIISTSLGDHSDKKHIQQQSGEKGSKSSRGEIHPSVEELELISMVNKNNELIDQEIDKIETNTEEIKADNEFNDPGTSERKDNKLKTWEDSESGQYFFGTFTAAIDKIEDLKQQCIDIYSKKFRITYSQLASYELEFVKNKDRVYESTNFMLGLKIGLIACLVLLFILDTNTIHEDINFWDQPGLYVYTTIGNLLLYRVFWWVSIAVWAKYDINYISILQLSDVKPNLLLVADQTATLLALYFVDLLIFYRANTSYSSLDNTFLSYSSPIVLVGLAMLYQWYEYLFLFGDERVSRGLFNKQVIQNCFTTPFVKVTFRDNYSADVLTSFTRILADSLYASCWVMSGAFLHPTGPESGNGNNAHSFGSDYMYCSGNTMFLLTAYIQLIPLTIRFLQCCRNLYDATPNWRQFSLYPQGFNAIKYLLSISVVLATVESVGLGFQSIGFTLFLIVITTIYKWWWDVAMDWGLFDVLPTSPWDLISIKAFTEKHLFLRKSLMYPSPLFYYLCIWLDLALRFMWVLSLLPPSMFGSFVGYQLKLFIASMELLRRCMWGILRVEYEHLKMLRNKTPGFLSNQILRRTSRTEVVNSGPSPDRHAAAAVNPHQEESAESMGSKEVASGTLNELEGDRSNDVCGDEEEKESSLANARVEKHELIEQLKHMNQMSPSGQLMGSSSGSFKYTRQQRGMSAQPPSLALPTRDDVSAFSDGMRSPGSSPSPFRRRETYHRDIEAYGNMIHYDSDEDDNPTTKHQ